MRLRIPELKEPHWYDEGKSIRDVSRAAEIALESLQQAIRERPDVDRWLRAAGKAGGEPAVAAVLAILASMQEALEREGFEPTLEEDTVA